MAKKKTRRRRNNNAGGMKDLLDGLMAGVGGNVLSRWLGPYGHPAAAVGVGFFRKNKILKVEGAREAGALFAQNLPFLGGGSAGVGGAY